MRGLILICSFLFAVSALACASFLFKPTENAPAIVAKNFDWEDQFGYIFVNKRNVYKEALKLPTSPGRAHSWVSKYGSITFNQQARELPLGGRNTAGLTVEVLELEKTKHPEVGQNDPVINEIQWVQWVLDSFATVPELLAKIQSVKIKKFAVPLHYFVCDKNETCATIDFLDGKVVVHTKEQLPYRAFTNSTYKESLSFLKKHMVNGQLEELAGSHSLNRFVRTNALLKKFNPVQENPVNFSFEVMDKVKLTGEWNVVYQKNGIISFRTKANRAIRQLDMNQYDFSCSSPVLLYNIEDKQSGNITQDFVVYSKRLNKKLVQKNSRIPKFLHFLVYNYPEWFTECLD